MDKETEDSIVTVFLEPDEHKKLANNITENSEGQLKRKI